MPRKNKKPKTNARSPNSVVTIQGKIVFKDGTPISGARVQIWDVDKQKGNADDVIVNATTDSQGKFSGSGRWRDGGAFDMAPTFKYIISYQGNTKSGNGVLNKNFFKEVRTNWLSPAQVQAEEAKKWMTISGTLVYDDKSPVVGARIKIWETDNKPNNPDDLIVNDITDSRGRFSGRGKWKDGKGIETPTFRYQVLFQGNSKEDKGILSAKFFKELNTKWLSPAQQRAKIEEGSITISGRVLYNDRKPIQGARIKIWEMDIWQKNNQDDLIVNAITDSNGRFTGRGFWKDGGGSEIDTYKYELEYKGERKTGENISAPKKFFKEIVTPWFSSVTWSNWLSSYQTIVPNHWYFIPKTDYELSAALQRAIAENFKIKPIGSGHSHSEVARPTTNHMLLNLSLIKGELPLYGWLKSRNEWVLDNSEHTLARVKAGTTVRSLCQEILAPKRLGLINMGTFDGQTISGAINTNTHGTGILLPGLADMVRSVEMFVIKAVSPKRHRVERWVIEPSNGISDPVKFRQQRTGTYLVQNDDVFYSAVCGYGLFGVVYSYTLEVRSLYWLDEKYEATNWGQMKTLLQQQVAGVPKLLTEAAQVKLYIHTGYCVKQGKLTSSTPCRIDRWQEKPVQLKPEGWENHPLHCIWPPMRPRTGFQNMFKCINGEFFELKGASGDGKPSTFVKNTLKSNFFEKTEVEHFLRGYDCSAYYRAIRRLRDNTLQKDNAKRDNVIDNTKTTGEPNTSDHATTIEICVPVSETWKAIEISLNFIATTGINFITPTGVRFTRESKHYLSPTYGSTSAFIEISGYLPNQQKKNWTSFKAEYNSAFSRLIKELERKVPSARFHMGKYNIYDANSLRTSFPRYEKWVEIYHLFNASGLFDCPNSDNWQLGRVRTVQTMAEAGASMDSLKI